MMKKINYKTQLKQEIFRRKVREPIMRVYKNSKKLSGNYCAELCNGEKELGYLIPGDSFEEIKSYMLDDMEYIQIGDAEHGLVGIFK